METLGLIIARGGSRGISRKNLRKLVNRPLIAWTIEAARRSAQLSRVIVSTDDSEIAGVARRWGAIVPFLRPAALAQDGTPPIEIVRHALDYLAAHEAWRPSHVMTLLPTSPLRTTEDIDACVALALERDAPVVVSVVEARYHPWLCRRKDSADRLAAFVASEPASDPHGELPPAYALNGAIQLNRCAELAALATLAPDGCLGYVMPPERALEVETIWDLKLAELILRDRLIEAATSRAEMAST